MRFSSLFKPPLRSHVIRRSVEVVALLGVIAGAWYAFGVAEQEHQGFLLTQDALDRQPEIEARVAEVQAMLVASEQDLQRVAGTILHRDDLGVYITWLEERAQKHRVGLQVKRVTSPEPVNPGSSEVEPVVPIGANHAFVELDIVVTGTTSALLELLHDVEHGQYLSAVPHWELRAGLRSSLPAGVSGVGSAPVGDQPEGEEEVIDNRQLVATITIIMKRNGS